MKKLLYAVPLLLIILSLTPLSLYKDKVDFLLAAEPESQVEDLAKAYTELSPSHWKLIDYSADATDGSEIAPTDVEIDETASSDYPAPDDYEPTPLHESSTFHGFPFAAYFSKESNTDSLNVSASLSASGYSWLWITVDVLLIIGSLVGAIVVNHQQKSSRQT